MRIMLILTLTISLIGIFVLIFLAAQSKPQEISGQAILETKDYVETTGKITAIKKASDFSIINLDNNITIVCYNCPLFKVNQKIKATGTLSEYQGKKQINAERIEVVK